MVIRATTRFNSQRHTVARQVARKCCPFYFTLIDVREKLKNFLNTKAQDQMNEIPVASKRQTDGCGTDTEIIEGMCVPTAGNVHWI